MPSTPYGASELTRKAAGKHASFKFAAAAAERQSVVLNCLRAGMSVGDACLEAKISRSTYTGWRYTNKEFAARADAAKATAIDGGGMREGDTSTGNEVADLITWRQRWAGHSTPWFQAQAASLVHQAAPGDIILVLFPPEHGKTTLYEDMVTRRIAREPNFHGHIGSMSIGLAKKILGKIMDRLNPVAGSPWADFAGMYGPFAPIRRLEGGHSQPWTTTHFDQYRKAVHDDRDYTLAALGFGAQIIGSRSLWLHNDDMQDLDHLAQTEQWFEKWRQDWLSRPGQTGFTTVFGNRVDEGDIYEAMQDELPDDVLRVVKYPAILERNGQVEPLWPERWPMEKLERQRSILTPAAWERNWMGRPRAQKLKSFTEDITGKALNPNVSLLQPMAGLNREAMGGWPAYMALDPSIGGRGCVSTWLVRPKLRLVWARETIGLTNNSSIAAVCREGLLSARLHGYQVTDLIIESMAFQKGLLNDEAILALRDEFGVAIRPHLTGLNKIDENIGVPSMVTSFLQDQIEIPYAADDLTRLYGDMLLAELHSWKPRKRGTELVQDMLMTMWFAWLLWRSRRAGTDERSRAPEAFNTLGNPLGNTETGLILRPDAYPSILSGVTRG